MTECPTCGSDYSNLSAHLNRYFPSHKPQSWPTCFDCGERYKNIGLHWNNTSCSHQGLSRKQKEIVTGFLMGDGCVRRDGNNPRLASSMITEEYLKLLDGSFPILGSGVSKNKSRETYSWRTKSSDVFDEFSEWYSDGEKVFPDSINLSSTVLKHWYVCDGHLDKNNYPSIGVSNEIENKVKIESMFDDIGLDIRWKPKSLVIRASNVDEFFDYIGNPLPGFRYKWP